MGREDLFRSFHAEACIGCGRCTYACVASQRYDDFSPGRWQRGVERSRRSGTARLWAAHRAVHAPRSATRALTSPAWCAASGPRRGRMRYPGRTPWRAKRHQQPHSLPSNAPRYPRWVTPELKLDPRSSTMLFVGCTPYFDVVLRYIRDDLLDIPRSTVRLLNALGVRPRLAPNERCCGHDAYWAGNDDLCERLALANVREAQDAGVKEIVTFCPECASAWRDLYPRVLGDTGIRVRTMAEVLAEGIETGTLELRSCTEALTYQDPCRLSKGSDVIEQPRTVLRSLGQLWDMPRSGATSACCGTAGWVDCDHTAKRVQVERLREAAGTGAGTLITACPKCLVHLSCADRHHGTDLPRQVRIEDLHVRAARHLS